VAVLSGLDPVSVPVLLFEDDDPLVKVNVLGLLPEESPVVSS
jgi:hypothetical protein